MRAPGDCARSIGGLVGVESSRGVAGCSELRALNDCQGKQSKGWIDGESEVSTLVFKVVRLVLKKVGYADPYHCGAEAPGVTSATSQTSIKDSKTPAGL